MNRRIAAALVGTVIGALVVAGFGTFVVARVATRSQELERLEATTAKTNDLFIAVDAALLRRGRASGDTDAAATTQLRRRLLSALSVSGIGHGVIGPAGNYAGDLPAGVSRTELDLRRLSGGGSVSGVHGTTLWAASGTAIERPGGRSVTAVTILTSRREPFFGTTLRWFLGSAVAAIVVAVLVSLRLARRLSAPLHRAVAVTTRIARGELDARLEPPVDDHGELATLSHSINAMGDALQRARNQERQFLLSVSHDLRTPLTSIRGYAEAIADGAAADPAAAAEIVIGEADRLERLVGDLLDLARLEVGHFELHPSHIDVLRVVSTVVEGLLPRAQRAGVTLHDRSRGGAPVEAHIDADRLAQIVGNLLTNAMAFARTHAWVLVERDHDRVVVQVGDDGPGIPAEQLPRIFERLYQADNQPTRRGSGTGLGLAIVAELTTRMGGTCSVRSVEGAGTTFMVRLPFEAPST